MAQRTISLSAKIGNQTDRLVIPRVARLPNDIPLFELGHTAGPDCAEHERNLAATLTRHSRVVVYLGFRLNVLPPGFDYLVLEDLGKRGSLVGYQRYAEESRVGIFDVKQPPRGTLVIVEIGDADPSDPQSVFAAVIGDAGCRRDQMPAGITSGVVLLEGLPGLAAFVRLSCQWLRWRPRTRRRPPFARYSTASTSASWRRVRRSTTRPSTARSKHLTGSAGRSSIASPGAAGTSWSMSERSTVGTKRSCTSCS